MKALREGNTVLPTRDLSGKLERFGELLLQWRRGVARKLTAGIGGAHENDPAVGPAAFPGNQALVLEAIEDAHHGARADVDLAADRSGGQRPLFNDGTQADQLRPRDVAACRQLRGMQRDRAAR